MSSSNWWNSVISTLASTTGSTTSAIGTALSSVFANKFASIQSTLTSLGNTGPGGDPSELSVLLANLGTHLADTSTVPQAEYGFLTILKSLQGKTDAASVIAWSQTISQAQALLTSASSIFG